MLRVWKLRIVDSWLIRFIFEEVSLFLNSVVRIVIFFLQTLLMIIHD